MPLDRRAFLTMTTAAAIFPQASFAAYAPASPAWRTFELTTRVVLPRDGKPAQSWVPVPVLNEPLWTEALGTKWTTDGDAALIEQAGKGCAMIHARWEAGAAPATLDVVSRVRVRDRFEALDPEMTALSDDDRALYTAATELLPTDGIVRDTALSIIDGATTDLEKARRIYDWVVESTERNPETRGCGLGDIASMLATGDLTGKCADLNALFVGLARSAGLPARDLYGLRVAPSAFGYKSLGAGSFNVTKAQHCRAEVFVEGRGWVAADPADVRKVVLQEDDGTLTLADQKVQDVRDALFGAAEGNWLPYGTAHDVVLPGSDGAPVPFLMYPQAEIDGVRQDELTPDTFAYEITAREIV